MLEKYSAPILIFSGYRLDLEKGLLFRGKKRVPLRPQALTALIHLVKNQDRVVPREELYNVLWPGIRVEEGPSLNVLIKELRETLGDNPKEPVFIETYPRRGYKFMGIRQILPFSRNRTLFEKIGFPVFFGFMILALVLFFSLGPNKNNPITVNDLSASTRSQFLEGVGLINSGKHRESRQKFTAVVNANPNFAEGYFWLGRSYVWFSGVRLDHARAAKPYYQRAISMAFKTEFSLSELGFILLITDLDTEKAKVLAKQALDLNPRSIKAHELLGWVHLAEGDPKGALRYFHQINVLDPTLTSESAREGLVYLMAGEPEEAARVCRVIIQAGVTTEAVRYCLMEAYIEMGEIDLAVQQGREMMRNSGLEDEEIENILGPEASERLANFYRWRLEYIKTFDFDTSYGQAFVHLRLGEPDLAFEKLQKEIETRHFPYFLTVNSDPRLNVFRDRQDADKVFLTFKGGTGGN